MVFENVTSSTRVRARSRRRRMLFGLAILRLINGVVANKNIRCQRTVCRPCVLLLFISKMATFNNYKIHVEAFLFWTKYGMVVDAMRPGRNYFTHNKTNVCTHSLFMQHCLYYTKMAELSTSITRLIIHKFR